MWRGHKSYGSGLKKRDVIRELTAWCSVHHEMYRMWCSLGNRPGRSSFQLLGPVSYNHIIIDVRTFFPVFFIHKRNVTISAGNPLMSDES